jgi:hypothetical protein
MSLAIERHSSSCALHRCFRRTAGAQPFSERKASLSARQVERQRRFDDGSRRLEHRGGDSHALIRRHELVTLGDHFVHFGGGVVHLESSLHNRAPIQSDQ